MTHTLVYGLPRRAVAKRKQTPTKKKTKTTRSLSFVYDGLLNTSFVCSCRRFCAPFLSSPLCLLCVSFVSSSTMDFVCVFAQKKQRVVGMGKDTTCRHTGSFAQSNHRDKPAPKWGLQGTALDHSNLSQIPPYMSPVEKGATKRFFLPYEGLFATPTGAHLQLPYGSSITWLRLSACVRNRALGMGLRFGFSYDVSCAFYRHKLSSGGTIS